MTLRPSEWQQFLERIPDKNLFAPWGFVETVLAEPEKRAWLEDPELQRNLPRALGMLNVRVWELWRETESPSAP